VDIEVSQITTGILAAARHVSLSDEVHSLPG